MTSSELTQICIDCKEQLPLSHFCIESAKNPSLCKVCKERRNRDIQYKLYIKIFTYLLQHPCVDCGETNPVVLEFDHQRNKDINVSQMVRQKRKWKTIKKEIEKCEVRCSNCHTKKTAVDQNWPKYRLQELLQEGKIALDGNKLKRVKKRKKRIRRKESS